MLQVVAAQEPVWVTAFAGRPTVFGGLTVTYVWRARTPFVSIIAADGPLGTGHDPAQLDATVDMSADLRPVARSRMALPGHPRRPHVQGCPQVVKEGIVMKHQHRPILLPAIMVLLAMLAIGGGPIAFVLLVMAAPLLVILGLSIWALLTGAGAAHDEQRRDSRRKHKVA
jgi:hypothetical protein